MVRVMYHPQPGQEEYEGTSQSGQDKAGKKSTGHDQVHPASNNDAPNHGIGRPSSLATSHRLSATRSCHSTPRTRGSRISSRLTGVTSDQASIPILFKFDLFCATKKRLSVKIVTKPRRLGVSTSACQHAAPFGLRFSAFQLVT